MWFWIKIWPNFHHPSAFQLLVYQEMWNDNNLSFPRWGKWPPCEYIPLTLQFKQHNKDVKHNQEPTNISTQATCGFQKQTNKKKINDSLHNNLLLWQAHFLCAVQVSTSQLHIRPWLAFKIVVTSLSRARTDSSVKLQNTDFCTVKVKSANEVTICKISSVWRSYSNYRFT